VVMVGMELEWIIILVMELEYRNCGGGARMDLHGGSGGRLDSYGRGEARIWSLNGSSWCG
jgi:hypothetical protein